MWRDRCRARAHGRSPGRSRGPGGPPLATMRQEWSYLADVAAPAQRLVGDPHAVRPAARSASARSCSAASASFSIASGETLECQPRPLCEAPRRRRRCSSAPTSRRTRSTTTPLAAEQLQRWPSARRGAGSGSPTRRWPGACTSASTTTPGGSSRGRSPGASGICLDSFHVLSAAPIWPRLGRDPRARRSSSSSSPTRRTCPWTSCSGAGTTAASRARAPSTSPASSTACSPTGYAGPLSLEVFNDVFRQADPDRTAIDAMRSLLGSRIALGVRALPPAGPARGVRVRRDRRRRPTRRSRGAPAAHAGVRARRAAPQQAGAALAATATSASCSTTGPATPTRRSSPIAVESADPDARPQRAEALLAPVLDRRREPGEADLSAVAAPDGTRCSSAAPREGTGWLADFLDARDRRATSPRRDLAHRPHRARPAVRGLRRGRALLPLVFDLGRATPELPRPDGLLRSRALASARRPRAARAQRRRPSPLHAHRQAELQHVAFACADALATARAMRERGVPLLAIPENYYDDLEARLSSRRRARRAARARRALRPRRRAASSCTSTRPASAGACSSRCSSGAAATTATAPSNSPVRMAAQRDRRSPSA